MKKGKNLINRYIEKLDQDGLRNIYFKYVSGDRSEVANYLSRNREIDSFLRSANCAMEWFDMVDSIGEMVKEAFEKQEMVEV